MVILAESGISLTDCASNSLQELELTFKKMAEMGNTQDLWDTDYPMPLTPPLKSHHLIWIDLVNVNRLRLSPISAYISLLQWRLQPWKRCTEIWFNGFERLYVGIRETERHKSPTYSSTIELCDLQCGNLLRKHKINRSWSHRSFPTFLVRESNQFRLHWFRYV